MTDSLRIGLIGCGDIATKAHVNHLAEAGYTLCAAYNPTRSKAEKVVEKFGGANALACNSLDELLAISHIDVVSITSPPAHHCEQVCQALSAGKHVLCEKPSALIPEENLRIMEAQRISGKKVCFFSSRQRYAPIALKAKEYIEDGKLGEVYRIQARFARRKARPGVDWLTHASWFTDKDKAGGGVVLDMGQYLLDMILDLLNWPEVESLNATTFKGFPHDLPEDRVNDVEEISSIFIRTTSGPLITIDLSATIVDDPIHSIAILGTKAGIDIQYSDTSSKIVYLHEPSGKRGALEEVVIDEGHDGWASKEIYQRFHSAIVNDQETPGTTPEQALRLTTLCQIAYRSAEEKTEIQLAAKTPSA
ncbi:Gfo/Idh/MocA family protein [Pelagicoccus mobilis]|uniref:Gfo/Idh/MocA family oxidoreductase n=1 Tax=Pelagicoccus mobilis TaxID=415221 RepID=A0A934VLE7_9BACT|nr:Gfo/Idh/MocA family oxidoreductase [Pelagicoccus mobilis]MBK1877671.1 Gfo/Idh/MocA family oxidoreductase [Pelagicoccus mobilis]